MRNFLLCMLLVIGVTPVVNAQVVTGPGTQEATGPGAQAVAKDVLQLEHEKVQCFLSTTKGANNCADWIQSHYADEDLDITNFGGGARRRSKAVVIDEIRSGERKFVTFDQTNKVTNVYAPTAGGEPGDDGTTVVVAYIANGTSETNGTRSNFNDFCVDVWTKQGGQWSLILMNTRPAY